MVVGNPVKTLSFFVLMEIEVLLLFLHLNIERLI